MIKLNANTVTHKHDLNFIHFNFILAQSKTVKRGTFISTHLYHYNNQN